MLSYSVIICTLDRPDDMKRCIASWLRQRPRPREIVVVHGRQDGAIGDALHELVAGTDVEMTYVRTAPSLVRQRNAGIPHATGDVVVFADDDAVYMDGYASALLDAYEADHDQRVGGVQGTIEEFNGGMASRWGLSRLFLLPRLGEGTLQTSAWPAFYRGKARRAPVRVFSGAAMSFRRSVLQEFQFDDALARYWVGDDFEMAYRVSGKYVLWQAADARLIHHVSPVGRDGARRGAKMNVVNHWYLSRKCFGDTTRARLCWAWSDLGMAIVAVLCFFTGQGPARLQGMVDGYRELWSGAHSGSEAGRISEITNRSRG